MGDFYRNLKQNYDVSCLTNCKKSSSDIGGIFIISKFSETCSDNFWPTRGASTPGEERMKL